MTLEVSEDRLSRARRVFSDELADSIAHVHVTGVSGEAEVGKTTLVREALRRESALQPLILDLDAAYSPNQLIWQWARSLARPLMHDDIAYSHIVSLPESMWPASTRAQLARLGDQLGPDISRLVEQPHPDHGSGALDLINELMYATITSSHERTVVLVFDHLESPSLSFRHPLDVSDLLWRVRSASQQAVDLRVVLVARPPAVDLAAGPDAAFYGDGQWLKVGRPLPDEFSAATDQPIDRVADVVRYTAGHIQTTLELLRRSSQRPRRTLEAIAAELSAEQRTLTDRILQHARSLHRLGSHLVYEIAHGHGPYEATPDASSKDVSQAMRQLHLAGIVRRPDGGQSDWELTDPRVVWRLTGLLVPLQP